MDFLQHRQRFRSHLRTATRPGEDSLLVFSEGGHVLMDGSIFGALAPLLDGSRSTPELARELSPNYSYPEVVQALVDLHGRGLLTSARPSPGPQAAFWESHGLEPEVSGSVAVVAVETEAAPFLDALEQLGLALGSDPEQADLVLVVTSDYLHPKVERAGRSSRPWLLVRPVGLGIWIGPTFRPGGPCYECLAHRLRLRDRYRAVAQDEERPEVALPTTVAAAAAMTATLLARWLRRLDDPPLGDDLLELRPSDAHALRHRVVKRPQCPVCGSPAPEPVEPPELVRRPLTGFRSCTADDFLARFEHHVSSITGVVQSLTLFGEGPVQLCSAPYFSGITPRTLHQFRHQFQTAGGKGRTALQARASALGEALERHSSSWQGQSGDRLASFAELGDQALHPNEVMLFSSRQYETRPQRPPSMKAAVPHPFDEDRRLRWKKVWSLTRRCWRYMPQALCYYDQEEHGVLGTSNGIAAGAHLEDALLHGLLELVERDSVALWWYNRLRCPGVALDAVDAEYVADLQSYYQERGLEFWVLDLTSDLRIPAFCAVSVHLEGPARPVLGFGAHLDPLLGVLRALTEMNQLQPAFLKRAERVDRRVSDTSGSLSLEEHGYLRPAPGPASNLECLAPPPLSCVLEAIEYCRERVEDVGLEMLFADLTLPDLGTPVVQVVVPGLRHFWRRLAPGRLYDAPVADGRLAQALTEGELNPEELPC